MNTSPVFPTSLHQAVADLAAGYFHRLPETDTVLVVNSCARGKAVPQSDLDMAILTNLELDPAAVAGMENAWSAFRDTQPVYDQFKRSGRFIQLHLDVIDGRFEPLDWDDGGGPDFFEVEVGNRLLYSVPLTGAGPRYQALRQQWLPYYGEALRIKRLEMVREACAHDLDHVAFYEKRDLHFQAFDRLYKGYQEFLQALFIARRTYPIAYNKWIRDQVVDILRLPELYPQLHQVMLAGNLQGGALGKKAEMLTRFLDDYCT
ncbi:MAG TPA: hypothetical protein PKE06_23520 [Flavilitoribacter sp.]|nr:hypothetical protein [Flavilitoribacter sp.]HMQ89660.1 hypothetical protein [Flavilitoribacter sp.]